MKSLPELVAWVMGWPHPLKLALYLACVVGVIAVAWPISVHDLKIAFFAWWGGFFFVAINSRRR